MSPLVKDQIERFMQNFDGKVYLVQDMGNAAIVLIDPAPRPEEPGSEDSAWKRISEPTLMLVDPARSERPRTVN